MALSRLRQGLGRLAEKFPEILFPVPAEVSAGMDPETVDALQRQATMQLGLGMMAARDRGAGLGSGLGMAMQGAQQGLGAGLGQVYGAKRAQREEKRLDLQDERMNLAETRQQSLLERQAEQDRLAKIYRGQDVGYREEQAAENKRQRDIDNAFQQKQYEATIKKIDALENKTMKRDSTQLRKEFRSLPSVKDYELSLPIYKSASKAPDTGYGDLQLIYSVGKLLDPGSVVREGELALTVAAGSPLQRAIGTTRFTIEKGGRLPSKSRAQIMQMLDERIGAYKQAYDKDFQQYATYASELDLAPENVVGKHAESAFAPKEKAVRVTSEADYAQLPSGTEYIAPDGKRRVKQ